MANSNPDQAMTQRLSWMQRIPIGRTLQFLASKFKYALGLGGQYPKDRDLLRQRDDLQDQLESLLAERNEQASKSEGEYRRIKDEHDKQLRETHNKYTAQINELRAELIARRAAAKEAQTESEDKLASFTTRIATLDEANHRLRKHRDEEAKAHHDRVESVQAQLNTAKSELEAVQTRLREIELSITDKNDAHQTHSQNLQDQLKAAKDRLESFEARAEEKNVAQSAEIDAKALQVLNLQTEVDELQLQLNSRDDLLRSTMKDLKARPIDFEAERVQSIIAAIEGGLPQITYPTVAEQPLQNPIRKSYKNRLQQMQAARERLLPDLEKQPDLPVSKQTSEKGRNEALASDHPASDNDEDDRIFEFVLSSMKIALPKSVAEQATEVFFEQDQQEEDDDLSADNQFEVSSHHEPQTEQQASTETSKPVAKVPRPPRVVPPNAEEAKRQEFYSKWPRKIYSNLPLDDNSIRLVEILAGSGDEPLKVNVAVHELKAVSRQYEALSYVCGEARTEHWIVLNGEKVPVYPNLHEALKWLRQPSSNRILWVDAVCINQRSANEKSKEVQRMGPIYNQAKTVNIFMGAALPSEINVVGAFMRFLNRKQDGVAVSQQGHKGYEALKSICNFHKLKVQDICQGFVKFCLQSWWRRIWTMQEFYLAAEEPVFYWGNVSCNTADLKRDFELLEESLQDIYAEEVADRESLLDLKRALARAEPLIRPEARRISLYISRCFRIDGFDTPRRLYSELTAKASNPHDYIYGLRAIFDTIFRKVFVPDYRMTPEMLFASLAVYLIVVEGWADLLWWYPTRYRARDKVASWWPDFSLRSIPHELDVKPVELDLTAEPRVSWTVQDHILHAEGYVLDKVYAHRHIDKNDGHKILAELWQFDHCMNWNHECNDYFDRITEADDEWVRTFQDMHHDRYAEITHFNSSFRGALLPSTVQPIHRRRLPRQIIQCLPCWDVLRWHAFRIVPPVLLDVLLLDQNANHNEPGYLEDIFSSRMGHVFRDAFLDFFVGACMFDWGHLSVWLRRFPTSSYWSASNDGYWASASPSSDNLKQRSMATVAAYNGYVMEIHEEIMRNSWCYSFYYVFLAYLILLDCDGYQSLAKMIQKLREAAEKLRKLYHESSSCTITRIQDLAAQVPVLAYRLGCYNTVLDLFRGRYLLWTWGGFRGISAPGVETCCGKDSVVIIADGLSFPTVVNDFNEETGEGTLAGCALIRGVDMLDRDTETAYLPHDYERSKKRKFKLK